MEKAIRDRLEVLTGLAMAPAAAVPDALDLLEDAIPQTMGSMLIWASGTGEVAGGFSRLIGIEKGLAAYAEGFGNTAREESLSGATFRQEMRRQTRSRRLTDIIQMSREAFRRTDVYQQMLAPWGIDDMARCVVSHGDAALGGLVVFRPGGSPPYTNAELKTLDVGADLIGRLLQCRSREAVPGVDEVAPGMAELDTDGGLIRATRAFRLHLAMQNQTEPGTTPANFDFRIPPELLQAARTLKDPPRSMMVDSVWGSFRLTLDRFLDSGVIGLTSHRRIPAGLCMFRRILDADLSKRQRQAACALAEGASFHDMAERWAISRNSVITHVNNLYDKLGVTGKSDLMNRYVWSSDPM
ncbi:DNA-binding CsgD family transcriptional regulator [Tamilnaduibacter salinus]|uniref:DNA-binding CsgD family transcriptional regulator n=1 Tax=Tamilnaduibacter salinus TaxID=1484056 RepID=A0A2U1CVT0_9GAMM|nr:helix-turn-helix transcriptional regulator [Tamilnaduibacter salinus]PVY75758.1 DNA-binding CsgD family transcriptional regulator [Tamilnaduibacter salinus]